MIKTIAMILGSLAIIGVGRASAPPTAPATPTQQAAQVMPVAQPAHVVPSPELMPAQQPTRLGQGAQPGAPQGGGCGG